jgi:hypothetical protein
MECVDHGRAGRLPRYRPEPDPLGPGEQDGLGKELWYWNSCLGRHRRLYQPGKGLPIDWKLFDLDMPPYPPGYLPTLEFRKPGVLGVWHYVNSLPLINTRFAAMFGGTALSFTWVTD